MADGEWNSVTAWAAIIGRWDVEESSVVFSGNVPDSQVPFGICASDTIFTEGSARVSITYTPAKDTCARLLFGYRSPNERYVTVGLGGYGAAYVLSEFLPSYGWRALFALGDFQNLHHDRKYGVEVQLRGQKISLRVDRVKTFEHVLSAPLDEGQLGLFTWGGTKATFEAAQVQKQLGKVFVVMQFTEPYQQLYTEVIKPVAREFDLLAYHVGEVFGPGVILQDIANSITESKIVLAEITPANQNVFYELGYAHALRKPTILLAEKGKGLPFDISGYRCLFYENSIGGKRRVEEELRKHFQAIVYG